MVTVYMTSNEWSYLISCKLHVILQYTVFTVTLYTMFSSLNWPYKCFKKTYLFQMGITVCFTMFIIYMTNLFQFANQNKCVTSPPCAYTQAFYFNDFVMIKFPLNAPLTNNSRVELVIPFQFLLLHKKWVYLALTANRLFINMKTCSMCNKLFWSNQTLINKLDILTFKITYCIILPNLAH